MWWLFIFLVALIGATVVFVGVKRRRYGDGERGHEIGTGPLYRHNGPPRQWSDGGSSNGGGQIGL